MPRRKRSTVEITVRTRLRWQRYDCAFCGVHARIRQKVSTYHCADPAWTVTKGPFPFAPFRAWNWRAQHDPSGAIALAKTKPMLERLLGRLAGETTYCRLHQTGVTFWLSEKRELHHHCADGAFDHLGSTVVCDHKSWQDVTIARCRHCGTAWAFDPRRFMQQTGQHTQRVHRGHCYGNPAHYQGNGMLRREHWAEHYVFEAPESPEEPKP